MQPSNPPQLARYLGWLAATGLAALGLAWIAFQAQQEGIAPAVLFPLAVGAALGGTSAVLARRCGVMSWRGVIAGALAFGLLIVIAQDYIGHRHHLRRYDEALARQQGLTALVSDEGIDRPGFAEYLSSRVQMHPAWWWLELALTAASAGAVAAMTTRRRSSPE